MSFIYRILKAIDGTNDWIGRKISLLILFFFGLLIIEVIRRYLFDFPSSWGNELVQMLFGAYVVLSAGHILRWGEHVNVEIVYARLPPKMRLIADIVTSSFSFLFCGVLLYFGGLLAWDSLSRWEHSESAWNPPLYPVKLLIPLGAFLLLLQVLCKLVRDVLALLGREKAIAIDEMQEKEAL